MPEPKDNENRSEFITRCMSDSKSQDDFPNINQRVAFCNSQWDRKGKK